MTLSDYIVPKYLDEQQRETTRCGVWEVIENGKN